MFVLSWFTLKRLLFTKQQTEFHDWPTMLIFSSFLPSPEQTDFEQKIFGPYVLSGGPLIFNVILFKRKAVYTEGAGPVCKCTGQCTLEGCILLF